MLPRLKDSIEIRQSGEDLYFYNANTGEVKNFEVDTIFLAMVPLLDGSRHEGQLLEALQAINPALSLNELCGVLQAMLEHRLIEDLSTLPHPMPLSQQDLDRFDRQIRFLNEFAPAGMHGVHLQDMLQKSHVVVLGLGGTGTWTASLLAQAGVGRLTLVDYDTVEVSNLSRQALFQMGDAAQLKTAAAARRLAAVNPEIEIASHNLMLSETTDLGPILEGVNAVVNCTDSPSVFSTSMWVAQACMPRRIPHLVGGGYSSHLGMLGPTILPFRSPCWGCYAHVAKDHPMRQFPVIRPRALPVASINVATSLVASIQALEILKVLTRVAHPAMLGRKGEIDLFNLTITYDNFRRHPRCELCGSAVTVTGGAQQSGGSVL